MFNTSMHARLHESSGNNPYNSHDNNQQAVTFCGPQHAGNLF